MVCTGSAETRLWILEPDTNHNSFFNFEDKNYSVRQAMAQNVS